MKASDFGDKMDYRLLVSFLIVLVLCPGWIMAPPPPEDPAKTYGVVIDAGSSGSRVRVYAWFPSYDIRRIPDIKQTFSFKVTPGISSYKDDLDGLTQHLENLIEKAKENVPESKYEQTPIYLMATAGEFVLIVIHYTHIWILYGIYKS